MGRFLLARFGPPNIATWLAPLRLSHNSAILDVGSGNGHLLAQLRDVGFTRLTGVDPYLPAGTVRSGMSLLKNDIAEVGGRFDLVIIDTPTTVTDMTLSFFDACAGFSM